LVCGGDSDFHFYFHFEVVLKNATVHKIYCLIQGQCSQVTYILLCVLIERGLNLKRGREVVVVKVAKQDLGSFPAKERESFVQNS